MYGGLVVVAVAAYFLTQSSGPAKKLTSTQQDSKTLKSKQSDLTKEDYVATYPAVTPRVRDIFMPLVARTGRGGGGEPGAPSGIPPELTRGEGNWFYTGMAEVNTVPQALVENTSTGDGVFLKQGERWRDCTVFQITPDVLTLLGPEGVKYQVKVLDVQVQTPSASTEVKPLAVSPNANGGGNSGSGLQGPIGNGNFPTPGSGGPPGPMGGGGMQFQPGNGGGPPPGG
jgi:hypothetical protein